MAPLYQHPSDNVASLATVTAQSWADSHYGVVNLVDGEVDKPAEFTGGVVFAFPAPQAVALIALLNHDLPPDGINNDVAATWQANDTNAWGSPAFSRDFSIPFPRANGLSLNPFLDLSAAPITYQYHRLYVSSSCRIGEVWIGATARTLANGLAPKALSAEINTLTEHRTSAGVNLIYDLGGVQRVIQGETTALGTAGIAAIRDWWEDAGGRAKPFLWIRDPDVNDAWLVRFASMQEREVRRATHVWTVQLSLEEVSPGLALLAPGAYL
jgi:hypothetical protein